MWDLSIPGDFGIEATELAGDDEPRAQSNLRTALEHWIGVKSAARHRVVKGLQIFARDHSTFTFASGCSGSDLYAMCLKECAAYFHESFEVSMEFPILFAADRDSGVQRWLQEQFEAEDLPLLMGDIGDCMQFKAPNVRAGGRPTLVPFPDGWTCGFSCLSKTPLNKKRKSNKACIQNRDMEQQTTETYYKCRDFMCRARPTWSFLENVTNLDEVDEDMECSDGEWILQDLRSENFAVVDMNLNSAAHGSWPCRSRKTFIALDGNTAQNRQTLELAQGLIKAMQIPWRLAAEDVMFNAEQWEVVKTL